MSLRDYIRGLQPVPDEGLFPQNPADTELSIGEGDYDENLCFYKRPGLFHFEPGRVRAHQHWFLTRFMMESLDKNPYPSIIHYKGYCVKRGRITGIVLDKYQMIME
ncbi:hypothetical protein FPOAC1_004440 [Fusarium poae]|uniref:hypothetical protein n=1 Tax=Fusarium poae TaxID=36050 RepID=UPI001CEBBB7D|nr:hypothetical protein FPOAC1_004440 [Fusarium poae]KAG8671199.1 hypothetical protein FPOAC1_004440 [Fusarium poae]